MKLARPINDSTPNVTNPFSSSHLGTDYGYINGTPIYASESGKVIQCKTGETRQWIANTPSDPYKTTSTRSLRTEDYGNYVKIDHGEGYATLYAHQKAGSISIRVGDAVKKGQKIGEVGTTGNSTGNHLHWEVRLNDKCIDPVPLLDASFTQYSDSEPVTPLPPTGSDQQTIIDQLRAERDTNWNLYQNERQAKIDLEDALDKKNKVNESLSKENETLKSSVESLTKEKEGISASLQSLKNSLDSTKVELEVCNGLMSNRKTLDQYQTAELFTEIINRIKKAVRR